MAERRRRGSVRRRVTVVAALAVAAVLALTSVAVVALHRRSLTERLDEQLGERAAELAELVEDGTLPASLRGGVDDDAVAQAVGPDDAVAAATPSLAGESALPDPGDGSSVRRADFPAVDDAGYRLLSRAVDGPGGRWVVHVGAPADDVDESVALLAATLAVVVPAATLVLAALVWAAVGRALAPVEAIRSEVAGMGGGDLGRRVPEPAADDEIGRLAQTMNAMLGRLEVASDRQRRFVADASHELRSPLTRMRSALEVDLAHPGTADLPATAATVLEATISLQRLVDDLLHLARADAGAARRRAEPVDLDEIVLEAVRALGPDGPRVDVTAVAPATVVGDRGDLDRAVGNLVENALRHARSWVRVAVADDGAVASVTVEDDGPGIPEAERERVFERFVRLDDARARTTGGTGLGLAIAREVAVAHDGTLVAEAAPGGGARLVLRLPAA